MAFWAKNHFFFGRMKNGFTSWKFEINTKKLIKKVGNFFTHFF